MTCSTRSIKNFFRKAKSMLVTDVGDEICWWQLWDVGKWFPMLLTDLIHSKIRHHHKVTNITVASILFSLSKFPKAFVMWGRELNWVKLYGEFQESRWMSHCLERIFAYFWIYMIIRENHEWNQNQADYINSNGWLILIRWS